MRDENHTHIHSLHKTQREREDFLSVFWCFTSRKSQLLLKYQKSVWPRFASFFFCEFGRLIFNGGGTDTCRLRLRSDGGDRCNCIELDGDFNLVWSGWWKLRVGNKNDKSTHNADLLLGILKVVCDFYFLPFLQSSYLF